MNHLMERSDIIEQLYHVEDPELGMNIVDLGLVYGVATSGDGKVRVDFSLTYPGCPFGPILIESVKKKVGMVEGVKNIDVQIVWDPSWNQNMMSEETLEELRFAGRIR